MPNPTAKKKAAPAIAPSLQLFKPNAKPALLLWLLVTTNPAFIAQLKNAKTRVAVAAKLGISTDYILKFLATVVAATNQPTFQAIQGIFQELSHDDGPGGGYGVGVPCPQTIDEIVGL